VLSPFPASTGDTSPCRCKISKFETYDDRVLQMLQNSLTEVSLDSSKERHPLGSDLAHML
jgi:hypothetical protein